MADPPWLKIQCVATANGFRVEIVDNLTPSEPHVFHPRPSATTAVDAVRSALNQYEMAQQFAQSRPGPATLR